MEHRQEQRLTNPKRFDKKPTLGELAVRRVPHPPRPQTEDDDDQTQSRENSQMIDRAQKGEIPQKY